MDEAVRAELTHPASQYSAEQKVAVAGVWLTNRKSWTQTSEVVLQMYGWEIPSESIRDWGRRGWWAIAVEEAKRQLKFALEDEWIWVQRKAMTELIDRLENGDEKWDGGKFGQGAVRVAVPAKDLIAIGREAVTAQELTKSTPGGSNQVAEALDKIGDALRQLGVKSGVTIDGSCEEGDFSEAPGVVETPAVHEAPLLEAPQASGEEDGWA
jgi:hypothetical protein